MQQSHLHARGKPPTMVSARGLVEMAILNLNFGQNPNTTRTTNVKKPGHDGRTKTTWRSNMRTVFRLVRLINRLASGFKHENQKIQKSTKNLTTMWTLNVENMQ